MIKYLMLGVFSLFAVSSAWCGPIPLPANIPKEIRKTADKNWASIQKTCAGLNKYSDNIKVASVSKQLTNDGEMISFEVVMPENRSSIPTTYKSIGQHCYFDASKNGRLLYISKKACMSVALDKDYFASPPPSEPLVILLKP